MMHNINMIHRDIKPANILIDDGVYKVCDYGLSSVAIANPHSMAYLSSVGSPLYAAPEVMNQMWCTRCDAPGKQKGR